MLKPRKTTKDQPAKICLYGSQEHRYGWLATGPLGWANEPAGDGELRHGTLTEAIWAASERLRLLGYTAGPVQIFAPGGERMAEADLRDVPIAGRLQWGPAPVYVLSAEAIEAEAARQAAVERSGEDRPADPADVAAYRMCSDCFAGKPHTDCVHVQRRERAQD